MLCTLSLTCEIVAFLYILRKFWFNIAHLLYLFHFNPSIDSNRLEHHILSIKMGEDDCNIFSRINKTGSIKARVGS